MTPSPPCVPFYISPKVMPPPMCTILNLSQGHDPLPTIHIYVAILVSCIHRQYMYVE